MYSTSSKVVSLTHYPANSLIFPTGMPPDYCLMHYKDRALLQSTGIEIHIRSSSILTQNNHHWYFLSHCRHIREGSYTTCKAITVFSKSFTECSSIDVVKGHIFILVERRLTSSSGLIQLWQGTPVSRAVLGLRCLKRENLQQERVVNGKKTAMPQKILTTETDQPRGRQSQASLFWYFMDQ